jgi:hypothetical protein
VLKVQNAGIQTLVLEAKDIGKLDDLRYIRDIFVEIDKYLQNDNPQKEVHCLRDSQIFPIRQTSSTMIYDHFRKASSPKDWFIADRQHLEDSFRGKIPLLALSVDDVTKLKCLPKALNIEWRKLTNRAKVTAETEGSINIMEDYTTAFRAKVDYILR